jgi:hypothetical protein
MGEEKKEKEEKEGLRRKRRLLHRRLMGLMV